MKSTYTVENGINRSTVTMDEDSIKFELEKMIVKDNNIFIMKLPNDGGNITCWYDKVSECLKLEPKDMETLKCYVDNLKKNNRFIKGEIE